MSTTSLNECLKKAEAFLESKGVVNPTGYSYLHSEIGRCLVEHDDVWYDVTDKVRIVCSDK